jgi:hypothetical protein
MFVDDGTIVIILQGELHTVSGNERIMYGKIIFKVTEMTGG